MAARLFTIERRKKNSMCAWVLHPGYQYETFAEAKEKARSLSYQAKDLAPDWEFRAAEYSLSKRHGMDAPAPLKQKRWVSTGMRLAL